MICFTDKCDCKHHMQQLVRKSTASLIAFRQSHSNLDIPPTDPTIYTPELMTVSET